MSVEVMNDKEIRYFSPARAGYHAVVYWILEHHPAPGMFLNIAVRFKCERERYRTIPELAFHSKYNGFTDEEIISELQSIYNRNLKGAKKKALFMYSIESPIEWPEETQIVLDRSKTSLHYRGESGQIVNVVHIRDPFNLLSSKLQQKEKFQLRENYDLSIERVWKGVAREFVRDTNFVEDPVLVNFNEWFGNLDYKQELGQQFGLEESCMAESEQVRKGPGQGSSFDSFEFDQQATKMKVLERYKKHIGHPLMNRMVQDEEVIELARRIYDDTDFDIDTVIDEVRKGL